MRSLIYDETSICLDAAHDSSWRLIPKIEIDGTDGQLEMQARKASCFLGEVPWLSDRPIQASNDGQDVSHARGKKYFCAIFERSSYANVSRNTQNALTFMRGGS